MLAELIRHRMQGLGINQRTLARTAGLSIAQISMILSRQVINLTTDTAGKLARALALEPRDVFDAALADVQAAERAGLTPAPDTDGAFKATA